MDRIVSLRRIYPQGLSSELPGLLRGGRNGERRRLTCSARFRRALSPAQTECAVDQTDVTIGGLAAVIESTRGSKQRTKSFLYRCLTGASAMATVWLQSSQDAET
jgi:hypothetical protein